MRREDVGLAAFARRLRPRNPAWGEAGREPYVAAVSPGCITLACAREARLKSRRIENYFSVYCTCYTTRQGGGAGRRGRKGGRRQRMRRVSTLRVIVFREDDWLCAQSVDFALGVQARTLPGLYRAFHKLIVSHIIVRQRHNMRPFADLPPANAKYRAMFDRSADLPLPAQIIRAPRGIDVPPSKMRVHVAPAPAA